MRKLFVGGVTVLALLAAGCGDDDDSDGDLAAYCALSAELDQQTSFPSDDQLEELSDRAPGEIADDVDRFLDAVRDLEDPNDQGEVEALFNDPEIVEAVENVEEFESESCAADTGVPSDDTDDTDEPDDEGDDGDGTDDDGVDDDADAGDDDSATTTTVEEMTTTTAE